MVRCGRPPKSSEEVTPRVTSHLGGSPPPPHKEAQPQNPNSACGSSRKKLLVPRNGQTLQSNSASCQLGRPEVADPQGGCYKGPSAYQDPAGRLEISNCPHWQRLVGQHGGHIWHGQCQCPVVLGADGRSALEDHLCSLPGH